jgi:hypothetical protein
MKAIILLLSLLIICFCCTFSDKGDEVDKRQLTGRFVFQVNNQDTIDVNSDGTYSNYKWWNGRKLKNSGTWIYDSLDGRVNFQKFSFLTDTIDIGDSTFLPRGSWITKIAVKDNEIRFIYGTDIYKGYFLKVDSIDRKKID